MEHIPTELLSVILTKYISSHDQQKGAVRLRDLQNRILTASSVSKVWNRVLIDDQDAPATVHTMIELKEVMDVSKYYDADQSLGATMSYGQSTAKLFSRVGGVILKDTEDASYDYEESLPKIMRGIRAISSFGKNISYLEVELPESCRNTSSFDCSILTAFPKLRELRLQKFKTFDNLKEHFPKYVKRLYLEYGEKWERDVLHSHSISIFDLPSHAQLDFCSIRKSGTLGVISRQIMDQISECEIDALFLLMSVAVQDADLLEMFQKPYKEGAYVPPHILGDWELVEMSHRATDSACTILLESLRTSSMLRSLAISGEASQSLKIIPSFAMNESADLSWISSITEQSSSLLYGMSGEELTHRLDILQVMRIPEFKQGVAPHNLQIAISEDDKNVQFVIVPHDSCHIEYS